MKRLKESPKLIYLGAIPVVVASYLVYKFIKAILKKDGSQKVQLLQNKPQMLFSKFIRNNLTDNSKDFYTPEHYSFIKNQILNLSMEKRLTDLPNIHPRDFVENDYVYISAESELESFVKNLLLAENVIGIDIEQTNLESYQGYNCLIQIATSEKNFLIDAILLHDVIPHHLKQIFENENIVKVFYSGSSDLQWINRDYGLFIVNYFDVHEAALFLGSKSDSNLLALFKQHCGYHFDRSKKKEFQTSDWRNRPLSKEQCSYAALDVHYLRYLHSVLLKQIIEQKGISNAEKFLMKLQQNCLKTYQLKAFVPKAFSDFFHQRYKGKNCDRLKNKFILFCKFIDEKARELDLNFEQVCSKEDSFNLLLHFSQNNISNTNILSYLQQKSEGYHHIISDVEKIKDILSSTPDYPHEEIKEDDIIVKNNAKSQRKKLFEESTKSAKPYDNCQILGPNGEHLSTTNKSKAQWYLKKQLATVIQEDPLIIKLNFKPSGNNKPEVFEATMQEEGETLDFVRKNQCVVCGQEESLTKYHLVPSNYRQHFPLKLKEHRALDIVLLCLRCLDKANKESHKFKQSVARKYDVPLTEKSETKKARTLLSEIQRNTNIYVNNQNIIPSLQLEKLINSIKKSCDNLVDDFELSDEIKSIFGSFNSDEEGKIIPTEQFLNFLKNKNNLEKIIKDSPDTKDLKNLHGKLLVEKLATLQNIQEFIHEWRLHFVNSLDPQFLPKDLQLIIQTKNL